MYFFLIVATGIGTKVCMNECRKAADLVEAGALELFPTHVVWNFQGTLVYGSMGVLVGFVGGLLGLGGAEFMAPLMLEMGMAPPAAAATAAYMNLFTSASNIVHYSQIPGVLPPHYTLWFCCTGFLSGLVGRTISTRIAASGKQSIVIIALASVLGV